MYPRCLSVFCLILLFLTACRDTQQEPLDLQTLFRQYAEGVETLNIPPLRLSYKENLDSISTTVHLMRQLDFFTHYSSQLKAFRLKDLEGEERYDFQLLKFEIDLHLERLDLEEHFKSVQEDQPISQKGLFRVKMRDVWYRHFLKRWLNADVSPEELYKLGKEEVSRAQTEIRRIQQELGYADDSTGFYQFLNADTFFLNDEQLLREAFELRKATVQQNLERLFPITSFANVNIARGEDQSLARVPGYYRAADSTFYYNIFDSPYNRRNVDWLYLHEAVPGHHYQLSIAEQFRDSIAPFREGRMYMSYIEGWAGYVEGLGKELGLYASPTAELGSWEWDLVRSVRVVLDIGLNYLGWSDRDALRYWRLHIVNQDDIARREIKRMRDWPAQVHTYKYGAAQLRRLIAEERERQGESFSLKVFHGRLLEYGALPLWLLEQRLREEE
ncbi:MAG: DUF885 family protein [Bacteroidota bacterium]